MTEYTMTKKPVASKTVIVKDKLALEQVSSTLNPVTGQYDIVTPADQYRLVMHNQMLMAKRNHTVAASAAPVRPSSVMDDPFKVVEILWPQYGK